MLTPSEKSTHILAQLKAFMSEHIYPNEVPYRTALHQAENRFASMPLMDSSRNKPRLRGYGIYLCRLNLLNTAITAA